MPSDSVCSALRLLGPKHALGTYVLQLALSQTTNISFGGFRGGQPVRLPAGAYCYVGSAKGGEATRALPRRLLRHATRSADKPPHAIWGELLACFAALAWGGSELLPKSAKQLHWHIDYLTDSLSAEIMAVLLLRAGKTIEAQVGKILEQQLESHVIAPGLGASDVPGNTHLLYVEAGASWWAGLPELLEESLIGAATS